MKSSVEPLTLLFSEMDLSLKLRFSLNLQIFPLLSPELPLEIVEFDGYEENAGKFEAVGMEYGRNWVRSFRAPPPSINSGKLIKFTMKNSNTEKINGSQRVCKPFSPPPFNC